jgi:thiaminase/transcriptional activator TenA
MALTTELRAKHKDLWEAVVTHPFVLEMGDGTLPEKTFRDYFVQDYAIVADIVSILSMGIAKAPDFDAASRFNRFITSILNPENDIFVDAFKELKVTPEEMAHKTPTTQAFGDFMVRVGLEGRFEDIATVLYVTEGAYLDWATRLIKAGKRPANPAYQAWIDIHGPPVLGDIVAFLGQHVDRNTPPERRQRTEELFLTALRYEYRFFEAAYRGERWPDEQTASRNPRGAR